MDAVPEKLTKCLPPWLWAPTLCVFMHHTVRLCLCVNRPGWISKHQFECKPVITGAATPESLLLPAPPLSLSWSAGWSQWAKALLSQRERGRGGGRRRLKPIQQRRWWWWSTAWGTVCRLKFQVKNRNSAHLHRSTLCGRVRFNYPPPLKRVHPAVKYGHATGGTDRVSSA